MSKLEKIHLFRIFIYDILKLEGKKLYYLKELAWTNFHQNEKKKDIEGDERKRNWTLFKSYIIISSKM